MITGQVYRIRTVPRTNDTSHGARKGSLAVVLGPCPYDYGHFLAQAPHSVTGRPVVWSLRPCDLQRLPDHEEINGGC